MPDPAIDLIIAVADIRLEMILELEIFLPALAGRRREVGLDREAPPQIASMRPGRFGPGIPAVERLFDKGVSALQ
jgi:hypothetical protein